MLIHLFRQKSFNPALDMEDIRLSLCAIAMAHHNITFTLRDEDSGKKLLQTQKFDAPEKTFAAIFGDGWIEKLVPVHCERSPCKKLKHKILLNGKEFFFVIGFLGCNHIMRWKHRLCL